MHDNCVDTIQLPPTTNVLVSKYRHHLYSEV